ncbi:MAG: hypothetical protein ACI8PZ_001389 [Myxococcota bacterium]|jgi:hypothetical protein
MPSLSSHPWRLPWPAVVVVIATGVAYVALAEAGWPGVPSACAEGPACWCEARSPGWIREPWNTWSNLPTLLGALWVAGLAHGAGSGWRAGVLSTFAYGLWAQGAGALMFHGSLTQWSRDLDQGSILVVWGAVLCTSLVRLGWLPPSRLLPAVMASTVAGLIVIFGLELPIDPAGLTCLATFAVLEVLIRRRHGPVADPRWFRLAVGAFGVAMLSWTASLPMSPLCAAGAPVHALWHVAAGLAVTALAVHAASSGVHVAAPTGGTLPRT